VPTEKLEAEASDINLKIIPVHFALMQNEPKDQGGERIGGGHGISASFYRWSAPLKSR